jgi:paired small multidrug resistance pump
MICSNLAEGREAMDVNEIGRLLQEWKWAAVGFVGALVGSYFHRDELKSKADFLMFFLSGWACANFLTSPAIKYFSIDGDSTGGVAFLLGAFGGSMISAVIRAIRAADLWSVVKQRFGGGS